LLLPEFKVAIGMWGIEAPTAGAVLCQKKYPFAFAPGSVAVHRFSGA
jgi:hypothetical protein